MKKKHLHLPLASLALAITLGISSVGFVGCTSTQQTTTYKTLYSIEQTSTAAVDTYFRGINTGAWSTNGMPVVSKAYNQLQADLRLATELAQNNTNALAPASLLNEAQDFLNVITTAKKALTK